MRNKYNTQATDLAAMFTGDTAHDAGVWSAVSAVVRHESALNPRFDPVRFVRFIDARRTRGPGESGAVGWIAGVLAATASDTARGQS